MSHVASALLRYRKGKERDAVLYARDASNFERSSSMKDVLERTFLLSEELRERELSCVAILVRDGIDFIEALYASVAAGAVGAPLHVRWSFEECASAMDAIHADALVTDDVDAASFLSRRLDKLRWIYLCNSNPEELERMRRRMAKNVRLASTQAWKKPIASMDQSTRIIKLHYSSCGTAFVCFTSGTTGSSKAARVTHSSALYQAMQKARTLGLEEQASVLHVLPLAHVGGLSQLHAALWSSCKRQVFLERFEARSCLEAMRTHGITAVSLVPPMLDDLKRIDSQPYPTMKNLMIGGGQLDERRKKMAQEMFPLACVSVAYGSTETFSTIAIGVPEGEGYVAPADTLALACSLHTCQARRRNEWCGCKEGKLLVRGPHVTPGYRNDTPSTHQALDAKGWLWTGDVGIFVEDGSMRFRVVGREKDVVRTGAEGVHAKEVEDVLDMHPSIGRSAVFGAPHTYYGEMVAAAIELRPGWKWIGARFWHGKVHQTEENVREGIKTISGDGLQSFCRLKGLSSFKLPRIIWYKEGGLPLNHLGKIMKTQLKSEFCEFASNEQSKTCLERQSLAEFLKSKL